MKKIDKCILKNRCKKEGDLSGFTYYDLLQLLKKFSKKKLKQTVQVCYPNPTGKSDKLMPIISADTIKNFEIDNTLNADDHKHHPEHFILLADWHSFGDDGRIATEYNTEDNKCKGIPIFPSKPLKWSGE